MLNRRSQILWIKICLHEKKPLYLSFPIPLYIFQELLDSILDLLEFACLFIPRRQYGSSSLPAPAETTVYQLKTVIAATMQLFAALPEGEPYDLVEVKTNNADVSIKLR